MAKFTMLIGIQGSGKSTYAMKRAFVDNKVRVLSSDLIREALLGDRTDQDHNPTIFNIMNRQVLVLLESGYDVIYDATNVSLTRRIGVLKMLPKGVFTKAVYFATPLKIAMMRDRDREYEVGEEIIERTYRRLDVPTVFEGFNEIEYIDGSYSHISQLTREESIEKALENVKTYNQYKNCFLTNALSKCIDFAQDNPNHTLSVSKHMYKAYENIIKDNPEESRVLLAALLHDCGKPYCREYKDDGYACFYGHDKISAQMAVSKMIELHMHPYDIAYISTLINLHMRMHQEAGKEKLLKLVGDDMYKELEILHQADSTAK